MGDVSETTVERPVRVREGSRRVRCVGRCHFRYSMEPALCASTLVVLHKDDAIKKMMSERNRNYT